MKKQLSLLLLCIPFFCFSQTLDSTIVKQVDSLVSVSNELWRSGKIQEAEPVALQAKDLAFEAGAMDFHKSIACHLYPIRVSKNQEPGFEVLNYDRWDICNTACSAGKKVSLPVYKFLKNALVRKRGIL